MRNFADIPDEFADKKSAAVWLQSIPYDGTSTWQKGADKGFGAFLSAAANMELYDIETDSEVYRRGVHILPPVLEDSSPEAMFQAVYGSTKQIIPSGKFLTFFGGEHSVSIGILKAFYEAYPEISILQIDAHADLRPEYLGSPYNHACALADANAKSHVLQVGIRSMDVSELDNMKKENVWFAQDIAASDSSWTDDVVEKLHKDVYITFDLDAFDPSILAATGTPEPGGLQWYETLRLLRTVFQKRNVLGFDLVELAPIEGNPASEFLVAKLYYKMLSYKFEEQKNE